MYGPRRSITVLGSRSDSSPHSHHAEEQRSCMSCAAPASLGLPRGCQRRVYASQHSSHLFVEGPRQQEGGHRSDPQKRLRWPAAEGTTPLLPSSA